MPAKRILVMALLLFGLEILGRGSDSKSNTLFVNVRPEVALFSMGSRTVGLKIRLSDGASAQLWIADSCSIASSSAYLIRVSGDYQVPITSLGKAGRTACLSSSDGMTAQVLLLVPVNDTVRCVDGTCSSF